MRAEASAGGLGSPKANNGARSGLSLALPRAQTPPFCRVGPKSSRPLGPRHPFIPLTSQAAGCSSRMWEQKLSHPAGGPRPLEGPPIPLSSFTGAPGLGHTRGTHRSALNPPKKKPETGRSPAPKLSTGGGGDSPASSAPLRPYPADFPGTSRPTPPLSPTAPRGRSSELGVPPVLPPPSPRQRRAARPHRSAPLPARPRPVPPQFGGGGGQRVGMGAGPVGLKLLRVSSGFPPGFFLPPRPGFWPPGGCGAWGGRTGREEVASPCGLVLTPEEPPWVLFLQAWGSPDVGALPKSPQTPQTPGQLGLGSSDPVLTGGQRGWDRKGWCGAQHPWMLRDWGWVLPPYTQWGLRGARPRVGPGHCTQCLVHCCHSTARFVCVKGNCFVWN